MILDASNVVKLVGHNFEQVSLGIDHLSYRIEDVESIEIKNAKETINFIEYKGKSFIQRIRGHLLMNKFIIGIEDDEVLLKDFLFKQNLSKKAIKATKMNGDILVNGEHQTVRYRLKKNDVIELI